MVSIHQPLDGVDTTDGGARDVPFRNALATNLQLPLKALTCWSTCHGSMTRWLTSAHRGAGITVEFPQIVSSAYLDGQAAATILSALALGVLAPTMVGSLEVARSSPAAVTVAGWLLDPQRTSAAVTVSVSVDGRAVAQANGSLARPVVDRVMRVSGPHGFSFTMSVAPASHRVCVVTHAAATTSVAVQLGGCRVLMVPAFVFDRRVDLLQAKPLAVRVDGWALDTQHSATGCRIKIFLDGKAAQEPSTSGPRPDVNRVKHATGPHGFDVTLCVTAGRHTVQVVRLQISTTSRTLVLTAVTGVIAVRAGQVHIHFR